MSDKPIFGRHSGRSCPRCGSGLLANAHGRYCCSGRYREAPGTCTFGLTVPITAETLDLIDEGLNAASIVTRAHHDEEVARLTVENARLRGEHLRRCTEHRVEIERITEKYGRLRGKVKDLAKAADRGREKGEAPVIGDIWEQIVALVAEARGRTFDDLHHAPRCKANHYERTRVPGPCTCGAVASVPDA